MLVSTFTSAQSPLEVALAVAHIWLVWPPLCPAGWEDQILLRTLTTRILWMTFTYSPRSFCFSALWSCFHVLKELPQVNFPPGNHEILATLAPSINATIRKEPEGKVRCMICGKREDFLSSSCSSTVFPSICGPGLIFFKWLLEQGGVLQPNQSLNWLHSGGFFLSEKCMSLREHYSLLIFKK